MAASHTAAAPNAGQEDTMAAPSSALPAPQDVIPYEVFRNCSQFSGNYRQHNAALKFWREELEHRSNPLGHRTLLFPNDTRVRIGTVVWGKGQDWSFDRTKVTWWSWREMVAQLDEKSMQIVVQGKDGRSCGLISCMVAPRPSSYDHKRHKKLRDEGKPLNDMPLPVWDFVIKREDGTGLRLHPQRSTVKVETFEIEGPEEAVEAPPQGKGGSWGRGTFKYYKNVQTQEMLRFDPSKGKLLQPFAQQ